MRNRGDPVSTFSCPKEVNEMKKRIFAAIMAFCMVFALAACGESGGEKASHSPQSGGEPEVTPGNSGEEEQGGTLSASVTFESQTSTVEEDGVTYMTAESLVPTVTIDGGSAGGEAAEAIEQTLTERLTVAQETIDEYAEMAREQYATLGDGDTEFWGGYSQHYSAEVTRSEGVLSVRCTLDSFTGGAHGSTDEFGLTFDLAKGQLLTAADLGPDIDALRAKVAESVAAQAAELEEGMISGDVGLFADGVLDTEQWYLSDEGLVVFAVTYEIAAYAVGPVYFTIPYSELGGLLNESLLME